MDTVKVTETSGTGPEPGLLSELGTILVIEDDPRMQKVLRRMFMEENYSVLIAGDGQSGLDLFRTRRPIAVILDLILPQISGRELCQKFKSLHPDTPVLVLSAITEVVDKVLLLELGADDYVTKPFSPKALVARVKALLRRVDRSRQEAQTSYQYGKLSMDLNRHEVTVHGKDVPLTAKEFGLLEHLLRHPGRVLTREVLLNQVWGYDYFGTTRTVDVHVRRLKQKIPLLDEAILSVKSLGYKLKEP